MVQVGDLAPDFVLVDQAGNQVKLSDLKGKKVLLSFHPLAWTPVCIDQMRALEANFAEIQKAGVEVVLGISVDAQPCKRVWATSLGLEKIRILADFEPKGAMAKAYGLYNEDFGTSQRANVVVDQEGKVTWVKQYKMPELPDIKEVIANL